MDAREEMKQTGRACLFSRARPYHVLCVAEEGLCNSFRARRCACACACFMWNVHVHVHLLPCTSLCGSLPACAMRDSRVAISR